MAQFASIARPAEGTDAGGFQSAGPPPAPMRSGEIIPRGQDFATVGQLYRSIERGLAHLADKLGADRLFIGPAFQQADETAFGWPDLRPITDLAGAGRAIERIVEQGEGARGDWADARLRPVPRGARWLPGDAQGGSGLRARPPGRRRRGERRGGV